MTPLEERLRAVLRDRLTDTEKELLGRDAMARVEALKNRTAAPGATGTAAKAAPLKGSTAMAIIHHEDASVYGKGVIHHPLSGRPEFKGLVDSPTGPMVRIQDGDLVLTIDDLATLTRWRRQFERAEAQLTIAIERTGGTS